MEKTIFSKEALAIIAACSNINNSLLLSYPETTISNPSGDIKSIVDFSKLGDAFPEVGLWDTNSFTSSVGILDNPHIALVNNKIIAKDNCSTIEYITSLPAILEESVCNPEIVTSTLAVPSVVTLDVPVTLTTKIKNGVKIFKSLKDLEFKKVGDTLTVSTMNKETFQSSNNSFKMKLEPSQMDGKDFEIVIPSENFLSLPQMDYELKVHEKGGQYRLSMCNDIFKFTLSLKR